MSPIDKFNKLDKSEFLSIFGNVFEKTEWIAEKCYTSKPYSNVDELFSSRTRTNWILPFSNRARWNAGLCDDGSRTYGFLYTF